MASEGYTTKQIAADVGLTVDGCRNALRERGIIVTADAAVRNSKRHDPNRIVETIVADAENLTAGVELIDYAQLDPERVVAWVDSLEDSRYKLNTFIRRLKEWLPNG